jgi:hypothetical protein
MSSLITSSALKLFASKMEITSNISQQDILSAIALSFDFTSIEAYLDYLAHHPAQQTFDSMLAESLASLYNFAHIVGWDPSTIESSEHCTSRLRDALLHMTPLPFGSFDGFLYTLKSIDTEILSGEPQNKNINPDTVYDYLTTPKPGKTTTTLGIKQPLLSLSDVLSKNELEWLVELSCMEHKKACVRDAISSFAEATLHHHNELTKLMHPFSSEELLYMLGHIKHCPKEIDEYGLSRLANVFSTYSPNPLPQRLRESLDATKAAFLDTPEGVDDLARRLALFTQHDKKTWFNLIIHNDVIYQRDDYMARFGSRELLDLFPLMEASHVFNNFKARCFYDHAITRWKDDFETRTEAFRKMSELFNVFFNTSDQIHELIRQYGVSSIKNSSHKNLDYPIAITVDSLAKASPHDTIIFFNHDMLVGLESALTALSSNEFPTRLRSELRANLSTILKDHYKGSKSFFSFTEVWQVVTDLKMMDKLGDEEFINATLGNFRLMPPVSKWLSTNDVISTP